MTRPAWQRWARRGRSRQVLAGMAGNGSVGHGEAWIGAAGKSWLGGSVRGPAGQARRGRDRSVRAGFGKAGAATLGVASFRRSGLVMAGMAPINSFRALARMKKARWANTGPNDQREQFS